MRESYECRAGRARTFGRRRAVWTGRPASCSSAGLPGSRRDHRLDSGLPGPVAVTYEAGPTGFGLARFLTGQGIDCQVAAPSKLQRPSGDRVKTDLRDARHLARLLHLGEIVAVTVPSVEQEAARDLVRAREDVRGDLMSARHRLSKLLLRQGIVYSGGTPWTGTHDRWLRAQRRGSVFATAGLGTAFDIAYDTLLATAARRDRLDAAITADGRRQRVHPGGDPAGLPARGRDVDRVRARGRDRGLAPVDRPHDRRLPRAGAHRVLLREPRARQGSITKTGNGHARRLLIEAAWHHRPPLPARRRAAPPPGRAPPRPPGTAASGPTGACTPAGSAFDARRKRAGGRQHRHRPRAGRLVLVTGRPRLTATIPPCLRR